MSQSALLKKTATVLDRLGVPFMLTGSLASSMQGEPRATHDIDLVVDFAPDHIEGLLNEFSGPEYYLSRDAIRDAIERRAMFNLLDTREGDKVDFWLLTDDPFDQSRFARRQRIDLDGCPIDVSSPEDTILMKLRWSQTSGGSESQRRDALRVYEVQLGILDLDYLQEWIARLGLTQAWERLTADAEPWD